MVYSIWEKNEGKTTVRLDTAILNKVKVQSINNIALPNRESKNFRGDAIRLGSVYVYDDT